MLAVPILKTVIPTSSNAASIEVSAWKTIPAFSENNTFIASSSFNSEILKSAPKLTSAKHISNKVVIKPPEAISCPALILSAFINFWIVLNVFFT